MTNIYKNTCDRKILAILRPANIIIKQGNTHRIQAAEMKFFRCTQGSSILDCTRIVDVRRDFNELMLYLKDL